MDDIRGQVTLRPWSAADLPLLHRMNAADMTEHLGGPETDAQVVARHEKYLRMWREGTARMFRITLGDTPAGTIGWWESELDGAPAAEAGWSVAPDSQGRGVAREALRLLIRDAAEHSDHPLLTAFPGVNNTASNALCRGAGFEHRGTGTEPWRGGELTFRIWVLDLSPLRRLQPHGQPQR